MGKMKSDAIYFIDAFWAKSFFNITKDELYS